MRVYAHTHAHCMNVHMLQHGNAQEHTHSLTEYMAYAKCKARKDTDSLHILSGGVRSECRSPAERQSGEASPGGRMSLDLLVSGSEGKGHSGLTGLRAWC